MLCCPKGLLQGTQVLPTHIWHFTFLSPSDVRLLTTFAPSCFVSLRAHKSYNPLTQHPREQTSGWGPTLIPFCQDPISPTRYCPILVSWALTIMFLDSSLCYLTQKTSY
ncbi:unnamed protein product [Prunus brigantina]